MIRLHNEGVYLLGGKPVDQASGLDGASGRKKTMAYRIMHAHSKGSGDSLRIRFDALASHDITYVGIIQTARASGLKAFPVPYAMTNCHNSLCAVGGTINEDDHVFGLSAAKKYGGIYVPANLAVIHTYAREALAKTGGMILGSDSHTRYGALGTMGIGEGGPELVKQILCNTYDLDMPSVVLVYLTGHPRPGVGPHDVALALVGAVFKSGFVKNKILEFAGPGIDGLGVDYRLAIDVMTTETACLSSIWKTDKTIEEYYKVHGRAQDYAKLEPEDGAFYDSMIEIDLSKVECMIALPFHPSNAFSIRELNENPMDLLSPVEKEAQESFGPEVKLDLASKVHDGGVYADQGIIAGCSGGLFENLCDAADILRDRSCGNGPFSLSIYPGSAPVELEISRNGVLTDFLQSGAVVKPAFCGPCFGAGDVPANNALSIRHTTRNFPNREGSKPSSGQIAAVALMDARSIAASAINGGRITAATDLEVQYSHHKYHYDDSVYEKRIYNGFGKADPGESLVLGPNITDWPAQKPLGEDLVLKLAAVIHDPVTTTDELIPSGETSSYRSNPLKLAEFTLSRRCPSYVSNAKSVSKEEKEILQQAREAFGIKAGDVQVGSCIYAVKPGDGSAREQAASCQKVLGTLANIASEYATKRYRSNCINWGILPFTLLGEFSLQEGDLIWVPAIRQAVQGGVDDIPAYGLDHEGRIVSLMLHLGELTDDERTILLDGCLMNYYARGAQA